MSNELVCKVLWLAHVSLENDSVSAACGKNVCTPRHGADSSTVAFHRPHLLTPLAVPDLHLAFVCAHSQVLPSLGPRNGGYEIVLFQLAELRDFTRARRPEVDARAETLEGEEEKEWKI